MALEISNRQTREINANKDIENFLAQMVTIPSPTYNVTGVTRVQKLVQKRLLELGFEVQMIFDSARKYAPLCYGKYESHPKARSVAFICHADTVFDDETLDLNLKFSVDKDGQKIISAPGVADNKGGVVVALEGIAQFLGVVKADINLHFVCSPNEEIGSVGFTEFLRKLGRECDFVLGFEPSTKDGDIITQRSGNRWYQIDVEGISAHAGRANGQELNAAHELLFKISRLLEQKQKFEDLKINVAQLDAGQSRYNVVCGKAMARIDIRFSKRHTRDMFHHELESLCSHSMLVSNENKKTQSSWVLDDDCPPLEKNKQSEVISRIYREIVGEIEGQPVGEKHVGGAADANYLSTDKNVVIDGLGPVGWGMHTIDEAIVTKSLHTRSLALNQFLQAINFS